MKNLRQYLSIKINYLYALIFSLVLCLSGEIRAQDIIPSPSKKFTSKMIIYRYVLTLNPANIPLLKRQQGQLYLQNPQCT